MSCKQDLSNDIFDFQSHFKMTAAFIVNKLFFYYNRFDSHIHKTYIHFLRKHLQTFAFCILTSNQIRKIRRKPAVPEPLIYQRCMKNRLWPVFFLCKNKVFNCFDFSTTVTHGAYTIFELTTEFMLTQCLNFSCSLLSNFTSI